MRRVCFGERRRASAQRPEHSLKRGSQSRRRRSGEDLRGPGRKERLTRWAPWPVKAMRARHCSHHGDRATRLGLDIQASAAHMAMLAYVGSCHGGVVGKESLEMLRRRFGSASRGGGAVLICERRAQPAAQTGNAGPGRRGQPTYGVGKSAAARITESKDEFTVTARHTRCAERLETWQQKCLFRLTGSDGETRACILTLCLSPRKRGTPHGAGIIIGELTHSPCRW